MINVTEQLRKESLLNSNYYVTANSVLKDGTMLSLKKEDFYIDGNGIVDSSDSGDFPVGVAIEKTATLALVNDDDRFSGYNFAGAKFTLFLNLQLSDKLETIRRGTFTVSKKPATSDEINLTLLDDMSKAEKEYSTNLIFPCSALEILEDACRQTGIALGDATFKNSDYQVTNKPENTTFRAVIGMVAALAGGNARIDENDNLRIITFEDDSNIITLREIPWYDINGKTILDIDGNEITTIIEQNGFFLDAIQDLTYDVDDILVTGVRYTNNDVEYKYGTDGYVITIDNKLLSGNEQKGVDLIGKELVGMRLRPFSCESIAIGYATFGDKVTFSDIKGNIYYSYLTDIDFGFSGSTSFSCNAKSMEELNANYPDSMQVEVDNLRKDSEKKISAYDTKLKQINDLAANTLGFYYTEEVQEDGSVITYRHDKPTLDDSKVIYKTGVDGFFLSTDGGQTWKAGFDSNGDAVLNILYAIGIQSDWINTRGFTARDNAGDITFRIDADTGAVIVNATELTIKGKTPENVANAEVEKFITEVYSPQIKVLQDQIDGQIEAFFGNYIPDNDNEPASTWADDITKEKHLGDLFYIVNNEEYGGQAYRYAKIDGEYKWDYVKDTAVVKALADAANAQNTANAKKRIFGSKPVPPYDIDDLWVQGETGDILKCQKAKAEGASYDENDWVRASKYTDDSAVTTFIRGVFSDTIENLQEQLDGKIQTWSQDTDPSLEWSETDEIPWTDINGNPIFDIDGNEIIVVWEKGKYIHRGDLWQNTSGNTGWRYDGNKWVEQDVPDYLFDEIDGKAAVYFEQPAPPYNEGDLWVTSKENGEAAIKTAIRSRTDGTFTDTDWIDFKYADKNDIDNAVKEYDTSLGQDEVFNKLTNGGEEQGIYIKDKKLYINANYILAGVLAGKFINAKGIKVVDSDNQITLHIDDSGKVHIAATEFSLKGKAVSEIAKDTASNTATEIAAKYATLSVLLSNEFQGIPTDSSGKYTTFPTCRTTVTVLYGAENVTAQSNISFSAENGISGSASGATYTVSGLSVDSGTITATATYNGMTAKKEFVVAKQKQGDTGNGISKIVQHYLATSSSSGVSTSSSGWTETVQIPTQDNRYLWNYEETFFTNGAKATTLPRVIGVYGEKGKDGQDGKDASDMTQLEIFNKLTNNGDTQGIYLYDNKIYLNATYIDTGYLAGWQVLSGYLHAARGINSITLDGNNGCIKTTGESNWLNMETSSWSSTSELKGTKFSTCDIYCNSLKISSGITGRNSSQSVLSMATIQAYNTISSDGDITATGKIISKSHIEASGHFYSIGTGTDLADLSVRGTKKRILSTKNYGTQAFYCYEMASPIFGDIGEASISEDGACLIDIDDIFQESTNVGIEYYVFLQKEGDGDCWVDKKEQTYFIVKGTPGLKFAFEIKARQADYEHMRFADASETAYDRAIDTDMPEPDYSESLEVSEPDYEKELLNDRKNIIDEMEEI